MEGESLLVGRIGGRIGCRLGLAVADLSIGHELRI
jgi:hypothetical protein